MVIHQHTTWLHQHTMTMVIHGVFTLRFLVAMPAMPAMPARPARPLRHRRRPCSSTHRRNGRLVGKGPKGRLMKIGQNWDTSWKPNFNQKWKARISGIFSWVPDRGCLTLLVPIVATFQVIHGQPFWGIPSSLRFLNFKFSSHYFPTGMAWNMLIFMFFLYNSISGLWSFATPDYSLAGQCHQNGSKPHPQETAGGGAETV